MMKPVDKKKNPGLAKLPKKVRNKMGYMKNGGKATKKPVRMASGGESKKIGLTCSTYEIYNGQNQIKEKNMKKMKKKPKGMKMGGKAMKPKGMKNGGKMMKPKGMKMGGKMMKPKGMKKGGKVIKGPYS